MDIHNYQRSLDASVRRLKESKLSEKNKERLNKIEQDKKLVGE